MKKPTPFGKYYLLERINVGGMAEVFRAKAFGVEGFERLVAVKRILPNIAEDKEFIRMFVEEAKLAVQLNHANIAQIFDLGVVDGAYYIALEHVHGRDLRGVFDRCRQLGDPMPVAQACFVVMKLCEGLDYAHNKRDQAGREIHLVHRDVSPQNVLVSFEGEVKIIDFGIAKAASKGNKTQAGILKGKFGYMSPEQVRGIPIDRRSDVFSCGIVLYELLTGERLFVGESDFSTLEKVRNVEILPPSTYNRRIPDELERIVLKALAKDPEDRYQNAIDLHDELQAFVYTAGEFYSRKDLAGWMKKTFGREIEEETVKLESYRQLKAPAEIVPAAAPAAPAVARTQTGGKPPATPPPTRRTAAMAAVGGGSAGTTKPPPPPRMTGQMAAVSAAPPPAPAPTTPTAKVGKRQVESGELAWDDDELETQIYDDDVEGGAKPMPRAAKPSTNMPLGAPAPQPQPEILGASPAVDTLKGTGAGPDLSSLVSTAKGWDGGPAATPSNGTHKAPPFANGSGKGPAPIAPRMDDPIAAALAMPQPIIREISAGSRLVSSGEQTFDPLGHASAGSSFGSSMLSARQSKNKNIVYIALGAAAVAVVAVVVVIAMTGGDKKKTGGQATTEQPATGTTAGTPATGTTPATGSATQVAAGPSDANTGFDLYVYPAGVMTWRLDGDTRTDKLPSRIRGIASGVHHVTIDAPPGFVSETKDVAVDLGKAQKIEIQLQPLAGIHGQFESTPPGAQVSLIVDGKREALGAAPVQAPLDPRKTYQVLFEKPGFVSVNRPVVFTGAIEEKIGVTLDKAGNVAVADNSAGGAVTSPNLPTPPTPPTPPPHSGGNTTSTPVTSPSSGGNTTVAANPPHSGGTTRPPSHPATPPDHVATGDGGKTDFSDVVGSNPTPKASAGGGGEGTLLLGSKPPCDILVDGSSTGRQTPVRDLKLPAGKHKITLVNAEFNIKETFVVDIVAGQTEKQIKDYSDRVNK